METGAGTFLFPCRCLLSDDNLCKQFQNRQGLTKCARPDLESNCLTMTVFLQDFCDLKTNLQTTKKTKEFTQHAELCSCLKRIKHLKGLALYNDFFGDVFPKCE